MKSRDFEISYAHMTSCGPLGYNDSIRDMRDGYHKLRARCCSVSDKAGLYEGLAYTSLLGWRGQWTEYEEEASDPGNGMGQLQRPQESRQEAV